MSAGLFLSLSSSLLAAAAQGFFSPFLHAFIPEMLPLASSGSLLEPRDLGSVSLEGSFQQPPLQPPYYQNLCHEHFLLGQCLSKHLVLTRSSGPTGVRHGGAHGQHRWSLFAEVQQAWNLLLGGDKVLCWLDLKLRC